MTPILLGEIKAKGTQIENLKNEEKKRSSFSPFYEKEKTESNPLPSPFSLVSSKDEDDEIESSEQIPNTLLFSTYPIQQLLETDIRSEINSISSIQGALSSELLDCFEKLGATMIFMDQKGVQEMEVIIDTGGSPLAGTHILITEYDTAPKAFNISFAGNPDAVSIFKSHLPQLLECFKSEQFSFYVNRIDVHHIDKEESAAFKRRRVEKTEETTE